MNARSGLRAQAFWGGPAPPAGGDRASPRIVYLEILRRGSCKTLFFTGFWWFDIEVYIDRDFKETVAVGLVKTSRYTDFVRWEWFCIRAVRSGRFRCRPKLRPDRDRPRVTTWWLVVLCDRPDPLQHYGNVLLLGAYVTLRRSYFSRTSRISARVRSLEISAMHGTSVRPNIASDSWESMEFPSLPVNAINRRSFNYAAYKLWASNHENRHKTVPWCAKTVLIIIFKHNSAQNIIPWHEVKFYHAILSASPFSVRTCLQTVCPWNFQAIIITSTV